MSKTPWAASAPGVGPTAQRSPLTSTRLSSLDARGSAKNKQLAAVEKPKDKGERRIGIVISGEPAAYILALSVIQTYSDGYRLRTARMLSRD